MSNLRVTLLGGGAFETGAGETVTFPTRKVRALGAYLAFTAGRRQSRDRLAGLLWGDYADSRARASLRSALSRLRSALPESVRAVIDTGAGGVCLRPAMIEVDATLFHAHLAAATTDSLERAVLLYRGPFLDGFDGCDEGFDDWLAATRREFEEGFQQALKRLLDHYVVTGAIDRGIQVALRLVHIDPLQEALHRSLMRLYLYQDRLGAALRQYAACRELLSAELGVEPAAETERLRAECLRQLPATEAGLAANPEVERDTLPERAGVVAAASAFRDRQRGTRGAFPSIAVLAFRGDTHDGPPRHLAEGLAEELAVALGRFREIDVIAPASAFTYREAQVSAEAAGRELGVDFILGGSLRVRPAALRITVRLLNARTSEQVWAERYDCRPDNVFDAQDEMLERIVSSLVSRIERVHLDAARRKRPGAWGAYDLWLRGWDRLKQPDLDAIEEARALFDQAIAADPHYARPYLGKALSHLNEWACYSWNHWFFLKRDALELARTAVRLDDQDNRAHCVLGVARLYSGDYEGARRCFVTALDLNPNDADVLANAACAFALIGDHESATAAGRRALRLAPHHPEWYVIMVGIALFAARHYAEAAELMQTAPEANCSTPAVLAATYAHMGRPELGLHYRDTVHRHYRRMVARGACPSNRSCVQWLLDLDPFRRAEDASHYEDGLRKAGLS